MKIQNNKETSIDEQSKKAINDYNTKKSLMTKLYYKIFLVICILTNIGLFIFIIIYNNKIKEIEYLTKSYESEFYQKDELYNKNQLNIDNKITNIIAASERRNTFFSYSFLNQSEYDLVKNFIFKHLKSVHLPIFFKNINYKIKLLYQSASDYFNYVDLVDLLNLRNNMLIIVNTLEDEKFGLFFDEKIEFNRKQLISNGKNMFLFSFNSKKMIKYIGKEPGLKMDDKSEAIFVIGKEEIVIYNYFYNFGGCINYPLKSFEKIEGNENDFIKLKGNFDIKNIEIFEIIISYQY